MSFVPKSTSSENIDRLAGSTQEVASVTVSVTDSGAKVSESSDSKDSGSLFEREAVVRFGYAEKNARLKVAKELGFKGDIFFKYPKFLEKVASLPNERKEVLVSFFNAMSDLGLLVDCSEYNDIDTYSVWNVILTILPEKLQALIALIQGMIRDIDQYIEEDVDLRMKTGVKFFVRTNFIAYITHMSNEPESSWNDWAVFLKDILCHLMKLWDEKSSLTFPAFIVEDIIEICRQKSVHERQLFVEERFAYFANLYAIFPEESSELFELAFIPKLIPVETIVRFYQRVNELFEGCGYVRESDNPEIRSSLFDFSLLPMLYVEKNSLCHLESNFWVFHELKGELTLDELDVVVWPLITFLFSISFNQHQADFIKELGPHLLQFKSIKSRMLVLECVLHLSIEGQQKLLAVVQCESEWIVLRETLEKIVEKDHDFWNGFDVYFDILYVIIGKIDLLLDDLKSHWAEVLRSPDETQVYFLYNYIDNFINTHFFNELDEFTQEYITAGIRLGNIDEEGSPYAVYNTLKEKRAVEVTIAETPTETLRGYPIKLRPYFFQTELTGQTVYVKDLPKLNLAKFVLSVFERLKKQENSSDFQRIVVEETGYSWENLCGLSLTSSYLLQLLSYEKQDDHQFVRLFAARFVKIIEYIHSLSTEISEGAILSLQDTAFLKAFASIGGCPYGKQEGINTYYLSLPFEFQLKVTASKNNPSPGEELIATALVQAIDTFVTNAQSLFYKDICQIPASAEVMEAAHQVILVRNIIGADIGLEDHLIFDVNSNLYYRPILNMTKADLLQKFYKYFRPSMLIAEIATFLNRSLNEPKSTGYISLSQSFKDEIKPDDWYIDTDKGTTYISEKAVIAILLKTGAIATV